MKTSYPNIEIIAKQLKVFEDILREGEALSAEQVEELNDMIFDLMNNKSKKAKCLEKRIDQVKELNTRLSWEYHIKSLVTYYKNLEQQRQSEDPSGTRTEETQKEVADELVTMLTPPTPWYEK